MEVENVKKERNVFILALVPLVLLEILLYIQTVKDGSMSSTLAVAASAFGCYIRYKFETVLKEEEMIP